MEFVHTFVKKKKKNVPNAASVENKCKVTAAVVNVIMTAQKAHSR